MLEEGENELDIGELVDDKEAGEKAGHTKDVEGDGEGEGEGAGENDWIWDGEGLEDETFDMGLWFDPCWFGF